MERGHRRLSHRIDWRRPWALLTVGFALTVLTLLAFAVASRGTRQSLVLSSGQPGGIYLPLAESIAELVDEEDEELVLEVAESDGSAENARRLRNGEADLALLQNDTVAHDSLRTLVPLHRGALHFIVREGSGIEGIGDLEGRRVGVGLPSSGSHRLIAELLRHFEVDRSRTEVIPMRIEQGCERLGSGEIEALLMVLSLKTEALEQLVAKGSVRMVGIGTGIGPGSEIEGFRLCYPHVEPYLLPVHAYAMPHGDRPGVPPAPVPTVAVRTVLATRSDLPDPAARRITRSIMENRSRLTVAGREVSMLDASIDPGRLQFPLHDGAAQYFNRNEPGFLVRYAEVIGLCLSLFLATYGLFRTGRKWLNQRQKNRMDAYYLELNRLLDRMLEEPDEGELRTIEKRLQMIRSAALHQLASERLLPDESFRIFQTVLAEAGAQVRHKLGEARRENGKVAAGP